MNQEQAKAKAHEVFGEQGYVYDRDERIGKDCYKRVPRFYVGSGSQHYGNGETWEDAFANIKRFRKEDEL